MTNLIETMAEGLATQDDVTATGRYINYWHDMARAALSAIEAAGYRVVPVEPTEDMCMAAHKRTAGWLGLEHEGSGLTQALIKANLRYKAMLAAAPKVSE